MSACLSDPEALEALIRQAHAEDVRRARKLIDDAMARADAGWVPRPAVVEALFGVLKDLADQSQRPTVLS